MIPADTIPTTAIETIPGLIVSAPTLAHAARVAVPTISASRDESSVYVSLAPGSVPTGLQATLRNRANGVVVTTALVDGGFDPVALAATAGDTLAVEITRSGSLSPLAGVALVQAMRPLIVVRTDPPPKKADVPLNIVVEIVFSTPVDVTTLTESVQLWRGAIRVTGAVVLKDATGIRAEFHPDSLLAGLTDYRLVVTQEIRDVNGAALAAPLDVPFTTESAVTAPASVALHISITTIGVSFDAGMLYSLCVDPRYSWDYACAPGDPYDSTVAVNSSVTVLVAPGTHVVGLDGPGFNCTVSGGNPRTITVNDNTDVQFAVTCAAAGSVRVTTSTGGTDVNLDGYLVCVDHPGDACFRADWVPANDVTTMRSVLAGPATVNLSVRAENCAVTGTAARAMTVPVDGTVDVAFDVRCIRAERIAFTTGTIAVIHADGSAPQSIVAGLAPAWSPDGARLAYECAGVICGINLDGTGFARLSPTGLGGVGNHHPAWSPDGSKIAFGAAPGGAHELYVMSANGTGAMALTNSVGFQGCPVWSPDGTRIAFDCQVDPGNDDICVVNADGTGMARLTSDATRDYGAAWKPDGSTLAFATTRYGPDEIVLMSPVGGEVTRLRYLQIGGPGLYGFGPTWSPDGTRLAFELVFDVDDWPYSYSAIYVARADGSDIRYLAGGSQPAWKP